MSVLGNILSWGTPKRVWAKLRAMPLLDRPKRFCQTLRVHRISIAACTAVVLTILFATIALGDSAKQDSDRMLLLGCEMLCECGPDFQAAAQRHVEMLNSYLEYEEKQHVTKALNSLLFEEGPQKDLQEARTILQSWRGGPEQAGRAIWRAGEYLTVAHMRRQGFPRFAMSFARVRSSPGWLADHLKEALSRCETERARFENCPDPNGALALCEANRRAILLIFLSRNYDVREFVDSFQPIVVSAATDTRLLANTLSGDKRTLIEIIAASEGRRCCILQAMKDDPTDKNGLVAKCMWEAIDHAAQNRETILTICSRLGFGKALSQNL